MATKLNRVLDHIHRVVGPPGDGGLTDGQLLTRFIAAHDEASFAALVHRYGPMVWRLCLRVLGHVQDAEDAFQATFVVLARRAAAVVKRESVGSFLYGVAYRVAMEAKARSDRRRRHEKQVEQMPHPQILPVEPQEWRPWLDRELTLLPEHYRAVLIACDLEGRSRKEAARHLRLSEGTVSSRLARGRCLLAKRLARYGLALSGGALATALGEGNASAHVPALLLASTVKAAAQQTVLSHSVEFLVKGALKTMLLAKLKVAVRAVVVLATLGASGWIYQASGQQLGQPQSEWKVRSKPKNELEALRRENELLKLNLEVVLEKVRAQAAELQKLKTQTKSALAVVSPDTNGTFWEHKGPSLPAGVVDFDANADIFIVQQQHPLQDAEAALKALRAAHDPAAQKRAADNLEKALKRLGQQLKKQPAPSLAK